MCEAATSKLRENQRMQSVAMSRCLSFSLAVTLKITNLALNLCGAAFAQAPYDLVIHGGLTFDPEASLDVVCDVGIRRNRIAAIRERPPVGVRVIDASDLVIAPGFTELHQRDQTAAGYRQNDLTAETEKLDESFRENA